MKKAFMLELVVLVIGFMVVAAFLLGHRYREQNNNDVLPTYVSVNYYSGSLHASCCPIVIEHDEEMVGMVTENNVFVFDESKLSEVIKWMVCENVAKFGKGE